VPARFYDPTVAPQGQFFWPYSGDTSLTEAADNTIVWVDADVGSTVTGAATPRRAITRDEKCNACHLRLSYHGGSRLGAQICVGCHAPDKTDYGNRPKDGNGVVLATTFDNIEERSVHFKVLIHRIHTGGRSGPASLQLTPPYTAGGGYVRITTNATTGAITLSTPRFRDMGEFPNDLANCTLCHDGQSYRLENLPADARPTIANETATLLHVDLTTAHAASEGVKPMTAACDGCHATAFAAFHAAQYTVGGKEQCVSCHGAKGAQSVDRVHGITASP
jgi:OmcA/MtrC family decaheme c-type cytochrome